MQPWNYSNEILEIKNVPFYWRLKENSSEHHILPSNMDFRFALNKEFGYFEYRLSEYEKNMISSAYKENENIGFMKLDSGQIGTYGASSNNFFVNIAKKYRPKDILEIGCGSGLTIVELNKNGFFAEGIDPSEYSKNAVMNLDFH